MSPGGGDSKVRGMRTLALIERVIETLGQRRGTLLQMLRGEREPHAAELVRLGAVVIRHAPPGEELVKVDSAASVCPSRSAPYANRLR